MSPRFSCVTTGVWELPLILFASEMRNLVRVECRLMIKSMVVDLEVDATLVDGFYYYCFFIHKKN